MATLLIAEKPNAAEKIAESLGSPREKKRGRAVWYEMEMDGEAVYVVPSVGHIFSLSQTEEGWDYPRFETEWVPSFETDDGASFQKPYFQNLERIAERCDKYVIATDYDTEGSVIGYNILRFICGTEEARRMKFSTLTKRELREAFENAGDLDRPLIEAGLARHQLDWFWGINLSRALTKALNKDGEGFTVLSTGRVQGPTLKILTDREREIREFEPEPYWQLEADLETEKGSLTAYYERDKIWEEEEAEEIKEEIGEDATVESVSKNKYRQSPPEPFNLTTLQTEASSKLGYSPSDTLSLAQTLYEEGLISYPRTSSQKLPRELGLERIVEELGKRKRYRELTDKLSRPLDPNEGKKRDKAHPAIHPTGERPDDLNKKQWRLYDLIVRRFLATFARPALRQTIKLEMDLNGHGFRAKGKRTLDPQWIDVYGPYARLKEVELPEVSEGQQLEILEVRMPEKETQPPKRYRRASLVREMEKRGLGTKATRSEIIETLQDRDYIRGKSIEVTELGMGVVEALENHVPGILSEDMTRQFEEETERIRDGERSREEVVDDARETLGEILVKFREEEQEVGEELSETLKETRRQKYVVGECPECGDDLRVIRSKKSGKRFVGCSGYPDCQNGFPLPQKGGIKTTDKSCNTCGMPIVMVLRKGRRPWFLCIDPDCPSKSDEKTVLDIEGVGPKTAEALREADYGTLEELAEAGPEELQEIDGIGESSAEKMVEGAKRLASKE